MPDSSTNASTVCNGPHPVQPETAYRLVMVRHGQSVWNLENRFTGWIDVGLTETGRSEAEQAGQLLGETGWEFDVVHTSVLIRAIHTAQIALAAMERDWLPVFRHWRLNERHYGALQGLNKKETAVEHGVEQVHLWRRSYGIPPPPLSLEDSRHPRHDPRYRSLIPELVPAAECLANVVERMLPYWYEHLVPCLRSGGTPLVVAHGNSIRALIKHLDQISDEEIPQLNVPTGIPLVYELDQDLAPIRNYYLGDPETAAAAAEAVARQAG